MNKEIILIANRVRQQVREWIADNDGCDTSDMWGACSISSYTLSKVLKSKGYNVDFVCGITSIEGHCWVELDNDVIIDVTATQFDKRLPDVYITSKKNYYEKDIPKFFKYTRKEINYIEPKFLKNLSALRETTGWGNQKPNQYKKHINKFVQSF